MPLIRKVTLTYLQRIQLAPYNHVDAGMIVEVEPDASEDGPNAIRDLAGLIASTWATVGPATATQVQTAVEEFDRLREDRRRRTARSGRAGTAPPPEEPPAGEPQATGKQRDLIAALRVSLGWSVTDLDTYATSVGVNVARMTTREAQALLQSLHYQPAKRRVPDPAAPDPVDDPPPVVEEPPPDDEETAPDDEETAPDDEETAPDDEETAPAPAPLPSPPPPPAPPQTPAEAEKRFYHRYGGTVGGNTFAQVRVYLEEPRYPKPATIEAWISLAETVRDTKKARALA